MMKFSCLQENLNNSFSVLSHLSTKNINLPILKNVLMKIENKNLVFTSTNLEIAINCRLRGKVEEDGEFTVPLKLVSEYINLLPNEKIDLELTDNNFIEIKCNKYETKIKGLAAGDFPLIPKVEHQKIAKFKLADLKKAIEEVIFSVSSNETRAEISGILFDFNNLEKNKLVLAGTDSFRLSERKIDLKEETSTSTRIIVPLRTIQELNRILSLKEADGETLELIIGDNQILFSMEETNMSSNFPSIELISRLIEGQYPNYRQIIPDQFKTSIMVNRTDLLKAVKVTSLFSKTGLNDVTLEINPDTKELLILGEDTQLGQNKVRIESELKGDKNKIVLNYRYLIDGLNSFQDEMITLKLIDGGNPCLVKGEGEGYYIVMPIKQ